jgi:ribosomal peptide maturation radical SAM protein 1
LRIALLSTPWPLFNRPSIQLGALKAFAERQIPELQVDCHHPYLSVAAALGYPLYQEISERSWLAECGYAALLFPGQRAQASRLWSRQSKGLPHCGRVDFEEIQRNLRSVSSRILEGTDWSAYRLVGFSVCFGQLSSALYFARCLKKRNPQIRVVLGGSLCSGSMGESLLGAFPLIDYVVSGEGEIPLVHLLRGSAAGGPPSSPQPLAGLFTRDPDPFHGPEVHSQVPRLDELPLPDYIDYFDLLGKLPAEKQFFPQIPLEISRGCWWRGARAASGRAGCAFCNLNLQWDGYRAKSPRKFLEEVEILTERHQALSLSLVDNMLPPAGLQGLFEALARTGKDLQIFAEIRALIRREELAAMEAGGMVEVQVGIEALSSRLLRKLNKGTTVIDNLEIMKNCEARGTPLLRGNLILQFPGSDEEDVQETLRNLEFAFPFRPLTAVIFWLGRGSPVWRHPERYGIQRVFDHPFYADLLPPEIRTRLEMLVQGYRGNTARQRHLWRPVGRALKVWKAAYERLHRNGKCRPLLGYGDGGDFLIIYQRLRDGQNLTHRLKGSSRAVYLFCEESRSLPAIRDRFPELAEKRLLPFLQMMVDKRLMFVEGERYLSLAVPLKGYGVGTPES